MANRIYIILLYLLISINSYAYTKSAPSGSVNYQKNNSIISNIKENYSRSLRINDTINQIKYLHQLGDYHLENKNFDEALDYISEALYLSDWVGELEIKSKLLSLLSSIHFKFGDNNNAYKHALSSLQVKKELINKGLIKPKRLLPTYMAIVDIERRKKNNRVCLKYLDSCFQLAKTHNIPQEELGNVYRLKASILIAVDSLKQAEQILVPLDTYYNSLVKKETPKSKYLSNAILVSSLMGRTYRLQNKNEDALKYFLKSLELIRNYNDNTDHQYYLLSEIAKIYKKKNQPELAYKYLMEAWVYSEEHLKTTSSRNKGVLKLRDKYKEKLDLQEKELADQNLLLAEKEKSILNSRFLLLLILGLVGISLFIFKSKINRNKQILLSEKNKNIKLELKYKNKELTTFALQLMERDDLLDKLVTYLNEDKSNEARSLKSSRKQLTINAWEEFEKRFIEINQGFYERLLKMYPDLTMGDLKYCALLKLNLRGKEISKLLSVTEKSVHMARYRIRKKFKLETDDNLVKFLNKV